MYPYVFRTATSPRTISLLALWRPARWCHDALRQCPGTSTVCSNSAQLYHPSRTARACPSEDTGTRPSAGFCSSQFTVTGPPFRLVHEAGRPRYFSSSVEDVSFATSLARASTADEVETAVATHLKNAGGEQELTASQAAAALQRLAQLGSELGGRIDPGSPFVSSLLQRLRREGLRELGSRQRAAVLTSLARLQSGKGISTLLEALVTHALGRGNVPACHSAIAAELTALLTAHGELRHRPRVELLQRANAMVLDGVRRGPDEARMSELRSLAEAAARLGGGLEPAMLDALRPSPDNTSAAADDPLRRLDEQSSAQRVWECATLAMESPRVFAALLQPITFLLGRLNVTSLAAQPPPLATLDPEASLHHLLHALQEEVREEAGSLPPRALCSAAWAFAAMGVSSPVVFETVAAELTAQPSAIASLSNDRLVLLLWSFAQARQPSRALFSAALPELLRRKLPSRGMADALWAYARVGHRAAVLYDTAERSVVRNGGGMSATALAATVWGFGHSGFWSPAVLHMAQQQVQRRLPEFQPCDLAKIVSGFAAARCDAPILFRVAAESLLHQELLLPTQRLDPSDTTDAIVAFATMYGDRPKLHDHLREQALFHARDFTTAQRIDVIWGLSVLGQLDDSGMRLLARGLPSGAPGGESLPNGFERLYLAQLYTDLADVPPLLPGERAAYPPLTGRRWVLPEELLTLARRRWMASAAVVDDFHRQVTEALGRLGLRVRSNCRTSDGLLLVEAVAEDLLRCRKWGVVLQRRHDFSRSRARAAARAELEQPRELGGSRLRRRLVAARIGCHLLEIPYFRWDAVSSSREAEEELLARLLVESAASSPDAS